MAEPLTEPRITIRPATVHDTAEILELVNALATDQLMLPRSPASVIENVRDFVVAEVDGQFGGCAAELPCSGGRQGLCVPSAEASSHPNTSLSAEPLKAETRP